MILRVVLPKDRSFLADIATKILEPIYGWQYKAFNEWFTGEGFKYPFIAEIYINGVSESIGFLSLKHNPRKSYLKISTLVIVGSKHKGVGYGVRLLRKAEAFAEENGYREIVVTVSEEKKEALSFFVRSGFVIINEIIGKYRQGTKEIILKKTR